MNGSATATPTAAGTTGRSVTHFQHRLRGLAANDVTRLNTKAGIQTQTRMKSPTPSSLFRQVLVKSRKSEATYPKQNVKPVTRRYGGPSI
ncbi:hypothetical protein N7462_007364 [Penicillium macrosclerotiorum]|uniref:uncharacterized protein n=1 Tax=Penicillium macrosclerotiorum TaxID=303699 RepID=UPI002549A253|nr:uncharacterized protein N7462_007364 [Penicillium macrosclerotiorum]KAJ5679120.1 hypothetical protein N7462_007364 [Penicillium macrosclerotiorum]